MEPTWPCFRVWSYAEYSWKTFRLMLSLMSCSKSDETITDDFYRTQNKRVHYYSRQNKTIFLHKNPSTHIARATKTYLEELNCPTSSTIVIIYCPFVLSMVQIDPKNVIDSWITSTDDGFPRLIMLGRWDKVLASDKNYFE